jgi:hypothetical protein
MVWPLFLVVLDICVKIIYTTVTNPQMLLTYQLIYNLKAARDELGLINTLRTGRILLCFSLLNVVDWSHNIMILGHVMLQHTIPCSGISFGVGQENSEVMLLITKQTFRRSITQQLCICVVPEQRIVCCNITCTKIILCNQSATFKSKKHNIMRPVRKVLSNIHFSFTSQLFWNFSLKESLCLVQLYYIFKFL